MSKRKKMGIYDDREFYADFEKGKLVEFGRLPSRQDYANWQCYDGEDPKLEPVAHVIIACPKEDIVDIELIDLDRTVFSKTVLDRSAGLVTTYHQLQIKNIDGAITPEEIVDLSKEDLGGGLFTLKGVQGIGAYGDLLDGDKESFYTYLAKKPGEKINWYHAEPISISHSVPVIQDFSDNVFVLKSDVPEGRRGFIESSRYFELLRDTEGKNSLYPLNARVLQDKYKDPYGAASSEGISLGDDIKGNYLCLSRGDVLHPRYISLHKEENGKYLKIPAAPEEIEELIGKYFNREQEISKALRLKREEEMARKRKSSLGAEERDRKERKIANLVARLRFDEARGVRVANAGIAERAEAAAVRGEAKRKSTDRS